MDARTYAEHTDLTTQSAEEITVFNLSSKTLNASHLSVLNKGLSFVPTTQPNDFDVKVDLFKFFRNIRLREFFATTQSASQLDINTSESQHQHTNTLFRPKSDFTPPANRSASIETFCRLVDQDATELLKRKHEFNTHSNLSADEKKALNDLRSDESLVIKPADKGGGLVVLNRIDYVNECERQLTDDVFYEKLPGDPTRSFQNLIFDTLDEFVHTGDISKKEMQFLRVDNPVIPTFYTLPKIHKNLQKPPGRPIVAGIGSLTASMSTFVDHFIRPLAEAAPSFIKDTGHLLSVIDTVNPLPADEIILVTFDVNALYTSIPHDEGLEALEHFLSKRATSQNPSTNCILEFAKLILTCNYFLFQDGWFLQKRGVAMGSPFAPSFANIYMRLFEEKHIQVNNRFTQHLILWKRYIDDVVALWRGSIDDLKDFFTYLNNCTECLTFSMDFDSTRISFLDVWIIRENDTLYTDLFTKPTARNSLLRADSCHPLPLKNSLPYSQFCRVKRICSKEADYARNINTMESKFRARGYKSSQIISANDKIIKRHRSDLLRYRPKKKEEPAIIFSTCYSKCSEQLKSIINRHWYILKSDINLGDAFQNPPRIVYKRGKNLRDRLVNSDLPPLMVPSKSVLTPIPDGNRKCGSCAQCSYTYKCTTFKHPHTGKSIPIKGIITCNTKSVIYLITCPCGKSYVGKTSRELKVRIAEHRSTIRCKNLNYPVAAHFVEAGHSVSALRYIGIEKVSLPRRGGNLERLLSQRENYYIHSLKTLVPFGLNVEFELKCFL